MKKNHSVVDIHLSHGVIDTRLIERDGFTEPEPGPSSRVCSNDSPYKESQLWLYSNCELQKHYNSIMCSTNLVDSCAAALNDITLDDSSAISQSQTNLLLSNQPAISKVKKMTINQYSELSDVQVAAFECWLNQMEKVLASYPTILQIFNMSDIEIRSQLQKHTQIFQDIVDQPCIVKYSMCHQHRALEERYHLLYLRAYEVTLLLEGISSKRGNKCDDINRDKLNYESEGDSVDDCLDGIAVLNDDKQDHIEPLDDYKFQNDADIVPSYDSDRSIEPTDNHSSCDSYVSKISTHFDSDLESNPDNMDSHCSIFDPNTNSDSDVASLNRGRFRSDSLLFHQQLESTREHNEIIPFVNNEHELSTIEHFTTIQHNTTTISTNIIQDKVQNWLDTQIVREEGSYYSDHRTNFIFIYKAKSEPNLNAPVVHWGAQKTSSTLSLGPKQTVSMIPSSCKHIPCHYTAEDDHMVWDSFQTAFCINEIGICDIDNWNASSLNELEWDVCFFGENYDQHFDNSDDIHTRSESISEIANNDNELNLPISDSIANDKLNVTMECCNASETDSSVDVSASHKITLKRRRQRNKKQLKKLRDVSSSTPIPSSTPSSTRATTPSSTRPSTPLFQPKSTTIGQCSSKSESGLSSTDTQPSSTDSDSPRNIRYNSSRQSFEMFSSDSDAPITRKIHEMKPEDFYDIIKMCNSNIDCVITVLGAEPNRTLSVNYCQKMRLKRYGMPTERHTQKCNLKESTSTTTLIAKNIESHEKCQCMQQLESQRCLCSTVSQTIAMFINFLIDCWNVFRNMRLYMYIKKILYGFYAAARHVTKCVMPRDTLTRKIFRII